MPNNDPLSYALMGLGLPADTALSLSKSLKGEDAKADDDPQERLNYFRELSSREAAGEKLDDEEKAWLAKARAAKAGGKKSIDDIAVEEFSKPLDLKIGPAKITSSKPALDLEIGPAKILNQETDLEIGPAKILSTGNTESPVQSFLNGVLKGAARESLRQKHLHLLPSAPPLSQPVVPGKPNFIPAKPGQEIGMTESGESVDMKGKKLGTPNRTAVGDVPLKTPDFSAEDVYPGYALRFGSQDKFSTSELERQFGDHLQAVEDNRDARGMPTDQFPPDYFKGMTPEEIRKIKQGTEALRLLRRGTRI